MLIGSWGLYFFKKRGQLTLSDTFILPKEATLRITLHPIAIVCKGLFTTTHKMNVHNITPLGFILRQSR